MHRILNFGSLNIDHVYRLSHFVKPGETLECDQYSVFAGGKGLNQSIALAHSGLQVAHAGKIGTDGAFLKKVLQDSGVDTTHIITGCFPTGHANIQVNAAGENCIVLYPGANHKISEDEILTVIGQQESGTWLMLQNEINHIPLIMKEAAKRGMKIAINPAPCTENVKEYPLDFADILFVNKIEAAQLSGCNGSFEEIAAELSQRYPSCQIVMTLGSAGAIYRKENEQIFQSAIPAEVVDTTSAGDTFCGFFLSSVIRGATPAEALKYAAKAAAVTVSRPGAAVSIPYAEEIF